MFISIFWVAVFNSEFLMDELSSTFLLFVVCFIQIVRLLFYTWYN